MFNKKYKRTIKKLLEEIELKNCKIEGLEKRVKKKDFQLTEQKNISRKYFDKFNSDRKLLVALSNYIGKPKDQTGRVLRSKLERKGIKVK